MIRGTRSGGGCVPPRNPQVLDHSLVAHVTTSVSTLTRIVELATQDREPGAQPRLRRPDPDAERVGGLRDREADRVVQGENGSLVDGEALECRLEDGPRLRFGAEVGPRVRDADLIAENQRRARPAATAPQPVPRPIDADPSEPCVEGAGVSQLRELLPRGDERLLRDVAGIGRPDDGGGEPIRLGGVLLNEHLERLPIAGLGTDDQVQGCSLHWADTHRTPVAVKVFGRSSGCPSLDSAPHDTIYRMTVVPLG